MEKLMQQWEEESKKDVENFLTPHNFTQTILVPKYKTLPISAEFTLSQKTCQEIQYLMKKFPTEWSGVMIIEMKNQKKLPSREKTFSQGDIQNFSETDKEKEKHSADFNELFNCLYPKAKVKNIYPLNVGTAGSTQFSSEDIRKAIYEFRGELKGNILGLIHSHHNLGMGSKFSSIDIDTLVENASNFPTPFFSLIVHNTQPYTVKYSMKINGQIYVFKGVVKFEEKKEIFDTSFLNKVNSLEEQQNKYCVPVNRESGLFVEKSTGSLFNSEPYSYNPIERKYYEPKIFKKWGYNPSGKTY